VALLGDQDSSGVGFVAGTAERLGELFVGSGAVPGGVASEPVKPRAGGSLG
jgi:hypothetical protein